MTVAAYITSHGFGHATRTAEVLKQVRGRWPEALIWVVSTAPARLFAEIGGATLRRQATDVGLAQRDALAIDETGTVERWRAFTATWADRVRTEAEWLRGVDARVVVGDVPPLAFAAAAAAGIPSVALANFSWDWIYAHLARGLPALREAAEHSAAVYRKATLLLELPFAGDLSVFPRREEIPLVARRPQQPRRRARAALGLGERPAVLVSFGGLGLPGFRGSSLAPLVEYDFLVSEPVSDPLPHVRELRAETLDARGLGYPDVIGAVDVVVTKPGYGIVSDAIAAGTRLVYTERGDFPEYPVMVREMERYLPAVHVSNDDLRAGRLGGALARVLARPFPTPADVSGAEVAARRIVETATSPSR
jgi:L-arabinokinase